jgi:tRNA(fMet)-specific endonuclease VapC
VVDVIYLLDTDILIFTIRGLKRHRRPVERKLALAVVERCRAALQNGHQVGISAITVSELEFGARKSSDYDAEIAIFRLILAPFAEFSFDAVTCPNHYGRIRFELESTGKPVGAMDLLIAAHACALEATLVTNNTSHFSRVSGLRTENWAAI